MNKYSTIDITGITLETRSLFLRPFKEEDLEDFYSYAKVDGVGELAGWTHHQSIEESSNILNMFINEKKTFAIIDKQSNKVIGSFGIDPYNQTLVGEKYQKSNCVEIGYVLSKDYWGRGYMPEASQAVLQYCFETLKLDAIFCEYFKRNTQSKRVTEKLGFNYLLEHTFTTRYGTTEEAVLTVLHKNEWENIYIG